jgi:hypothetical protein
MSANNEVQIKKHMYEWNVMDVDVDTGAANLYIGRTDDLDKAIDIANKYMEECAEEGYPVEYGLNIIKSN